jgi:hypothetical protein
MRLKLECDVCSEIVTVLYNEDGLYECTCSKGHTKRYQMEIQRFVELFEIAVFAFEDGYYREAITSSTAAMERFFEFCTKVFLGVEKISGESYEKIWKKIRNTSERQLGAYYMLYFNVFKGVPPTFPEKQTKLRNEVVHKGKIPSQKETDEYLRNAYSLIMQTLVLLNMKMENERKEVTEKDAIDLIEKSSLCKKDSEKISGIVINSFININSKTKDNYDERLYVFRIRNKLK